MLSLTNLMSSFRHKPQIIGNAFHLLFVLSLKYCCPIAYRGHLTCTACEQLLMCDFCVQSWARGGGIYLKLSASRTKTWILFSFERLAHFVAAHNCALLYIMLGTKPKLAAQWEIIPNKSPINSWWIHASSEKEEDELDWCTRWCFLHGHWRNQVGNMVFQRT